MHLCVHVNAGVRVHVRDPCVSVHALDPLLGLISSHTTPLFPSEAPFQAAVGDRSLYNRMLSSAFSLKECNVALTER